jgi:hypothetical protein
MHVCSLLCHSKLRQRCTDTIGVKALAISTNPAKGKAIFVTVIDPATVITMVAEQDELHHMNRWSMTPSSLLQAPMLKEVCVLVIVAQTYVYW